MPITKTAKRALRASKRKREVNVRISKKFEIAVRSARKSKSLKAVTSAFSLVDRAVKNKIIHKNKAARIKSSLSNLLPKSGSKKGKSTQSKRSASSKNKK